MPYLANNFPSLLYYCASQYNISGHNPTPLVFQAMDNTVSVFTQICALLKGDINPTYILYTQHNETEPNGSWTAALNATTSKGEITCFSFTGDANSDSLTLTLLQKAVSAACAFPALPSALRDSILSAENLGQIFTALQEWNQPSSSHGYSLGTLLATTAIAAVGAAVAGHLAGKYVVGPAINHIRNRHTSSTEVTELQERGERPKETSKKWTDLCPQLPSFLSWGTRVESTRQHNERTELLASQ